MEKVTITFNDGAAIEAEVNGNCYITDEKPDFPADLTNVTVSGEDEETIENAQIIEAASIDGRYWFAILEIPADELAKEKTDAQILYTALVTDTLLED